MVSGIGGAILAPLLPLALNKLLDSLLEYLSRDEPSSSGDADKLHHLDNEQKAFERAIRKLEIMQDAVRRLHKRDKQNKSLIRINNELRDVSYEIQDLKDDLEYMEQQRKVEEINLQDDEADKGQSKGSKRVFWLSSAPRESSDKRHRVSSSKSTDDMVNKMRIIIEQINCIHSEMTNAIQLGVWSNEIALKGGCDSCEQHQVAGSKRVTTSSPTERELYGRYDEFRHLIELVLRESNVSGNIYVIPIVGMGGIGKTTLAQFIFKSKEIANHFHNKAWVCISDYFTRFRITKEILDSLTDKYGTTTSLDVLEGKIKEQVTGKKFLLVLDDVWSDDWRELLNFLQSAEAMAIKLIVTCRDPKTSGVLADGQNLITLKGLSEENCRLLLMKYAFAGKNPDDYQQLHTIGWQIVGKLKGSPLAAKTVGRLLGSRLTEEHWKEILESDLWKLDTDERGIMSALALSYYHLPHPLQLCFAFCSVFPKDFVYDMNNIIGMWVAQGYIQDIEDSSKTLEDIGEEYWHELEVRGFFEKVNYKAFKVHDLLHDLTQSVSHGEIYIYNGRKDEEIPKGVRHLCVHGLYDLELVCKTISLRTLVLYGVGDIHAILNHRAVKRIQVLVIFDTNVQELPDDIAHLEHLKYLDLKNTNIKSIPELLCGLYLLRVLILPCPPCTLPGRFHNLINLRRLFMFDLYADTFPQASDHVTYQVEKEGGYRIAQLRNMNELRGILFIGGLGNIDNMKEVVNVKYLKEKRHIKELKLIWRGTMDDCNHDVQEQVLEALQPHPNLKCLIIYDYMGSKSPSWLMSLEFQKLEEIALNECRKWPCLPTELRLLPSLKRLKLSAFDDSATKMYPPLEYLDLSQATLSFKAI